MRNLLTILILALLPMLASAQKFDTLGNFQGGQDEEAATKVPEGVNPDDLNLKRSKKDGSLANDGEDPVLPGVKSKHCCTGQMVNSNNPPTEQSAEPTGVAPSTDPSKAADKSK